MTLFVGDVLHRHDECNEGESHVNRSQPLRRFGFPLLFIPTVIACVALTPGLAAAEEKADPAAVASGLQKIQDIAADSAKAVGKDGAKAEQLQAGIEPVWEKIEGAVKANETGTYVALEDNFTLLKIAAKGGDASKASTAADKLSAAVEDYLAKHPGGADSASGSRSAAAAEPAPASSGSASAAAGGTRPDNLPRTGTRSDLLQVSAGAALALGGLSLIGGARKRVRQG